MKNTHSSTVNKVPGVGSIPLLGTLFKTTSTSDQRTELFIEITPMSCRPRRKRRI